MMVCRLSSGRPGWGLTITFAACALAVVAGSLTAGCNGSPAPSDLATSTTGRSTSTQPQTCQSPAAGCACPTEGASADCGQVDRRSGTYVTCSMGTTTCTQGVWSACVGDRIATKQVPLGGLHTTDLGTPNACASNPCDPSCTDVVDTAGGLDAGANFTATDSGLTPLPIQNPDASVPCTGLSINPPTLDLTVTGLSPIVTNPPAANLTASYTPAACYMTFANAAWSVDKQYLAAISGGTLTLVGAVAGPIQVTAYSAGFQSSAVVHVTTKVVDSSQVTAAVAQKFVGNGTQADNITVLYPYAHTVFPRSVAAPIVQWDNGGVAATAVKVTVQYPATGTPTYSVSTIVPESSPPSVALGQDAWGYLDATAAGQDALISIQRLVGSTLMQPVSETVHFATQPLRGNIFYTEYDVTAWTATIKTAKPYGTTPAAIALPNSGCNPCHSVAASGTTLVSSNWGNNDTSVARVNADGTLTGLANMWNSSGTDSRGFAYSAITPDGQYALQGANWWGNTLDGTQTQGSSKPHNDGAGLTGRYYANTTLSGTPVVVETDPTVDFVWGNGAPAAGVAAGSSYSVSWKGWVQPIFSEAYTFEVESSDGASLTVNGQALVNQLQAQPDAKATGTIALTAGVEVPIVLKYENVSNAAQVHLRWSSAHQPYQAVPVTQLYPDIANGSGLAGTYYGNIDLTGSTITRIDPTVDFNWNGGAAVPGSNGNNWSAEWTGQALTPCTGTYQWCVTGDDGVRLWVDGARVANGWVYQGPTQYCSAAIAETAGTLHTLTFDYFQGGGGSVAQLQWKSSCAGSGVIPSSDLVPPAVSTPTNGLTATYYANIDFSGAATTRIDPTVDFNWNGGAPVPGSSGSNWSAEWTGQALTPCTGTYQWCVTGDDGVRLWVDGAIAGDGWFSQGPTTYCSGNLGEIGGTLHDIKLDYFQGGGGSVAQLQWSSSCAGSGVIPTGDLFPTGDQGLGGYDLPFRNAGDRGTGIPYAIDRLPTAVGGSPLDVSALATNAWGLGSTAMMVPAFSPDGTKLVFVDGDTSAGASWRQGLSIFDFNQGSMQFGNRRNVVNTVGAANIVRWPAFESDSRSVIYQTNPAAVDDLQYGGMLPSGYSSIPGQLWSVDVTNPVAHPPVSLDTLNAGLGPADANRSYQPTVLPQSAGSYRWTVFTSDRQYGNTMNVPTSGVTPTTQLWVGALDDAVSTGTDRSHPPFWLPNQVLGTNGGRIRNERAYWVLNACKASLPDLNPPSGPTAAQFTPGDMDIGGVGLPGSSSASSAPPVTFTVVAGGDDIWNQNDAFHYVYAPVSGDFQFVARVTSLQWADYWSKAGVMLRDNLSSGSAHAFMMINAGALTGFQWRSTNGGSSDWTQGPGASFPYWVRLSRSGSVVSGDVSPDGVTWTNVGAQTPSVGSNAYIGLAVTAHNNGTTTTATFDNVGFGAASVPDPRPASVCLDDSDCCGALASPPTAACMVDVPVTQPVTRHCLALSSNSCVPIGSSCTSDSDCCGFPSNHCTARTCAVPPPPFSYSDLIFTRDYVASCPSQQKPIWRFFDWQTVTPEDSDIKFYAATAATAAGLPATPSPPAVYLGLAAGAPITTWTGADVGAALTASQQSPSFWYLRIFVDFQPTSDLTQGPTLTAWRQQYDCVDAE
jgi:regulation of enolase protein 1 (concanavalin A-like superfamily)